ncbi:MAG: DNA primase, partial [Pseudomonadales bacterium]
MAGRIPQPFIDDLIDRSDIVEVVGSRLQLKKSGKNYSACCPFHDEKTPSFTVSPQKQFYYCFGCGAGGNVIGFLMEHDHLDFPQAVEHLAKAAGMEIPREESSPQAEAQQRRRLDIYSELEAASRFYQMQLRKHKPAIDYLKSRGLTGQIAKEFALGYAPNEWDSLIKLKADNPEALRLLAEGGMLIKRDDDGKQQNSDRRPASSNDRSHYDRFRDRVMFPIRDQRGRTIAFGGRVLGEQKPKYLNSPETPVFHKSRELYGLYEALQQRQRPDELIVVEGYMDVVALAQFGVRNAVATLGTSVGSAHMDRIFRHVSQ